MQSISFDIDNTLLYTKPLVRDCYESAGLSFTDDEWNNVWGRPWADWLPELAGDDLKAYEIHTRKNRMYVDLLETSHVAILGRMPAARLAAELIDRVYCEVTFITSASSIAARAVLDYLNLPLEQLTCTGISRNEKVRYANNRAPRHVHVDDDFTVTDQLGAAGIHSTLAKTYDELKAEVFDAWMRLS